MNTLIIDARYREAPVTTQMKRFDKAVEFVHYAMLFVRQYAHRPSAWRSWLTMGFHTGVRNAPPEAVREDRITLTTRPDGKLFEISARASATSLGPLCEVLESIEHNRRSLGGRPEAERLDSVLASDQFMWQVLAPMRDALTRSGIDADGIAAFEAMMRRAVLALTDPRIERLEYRVGP